MVRSPSSIITLYRAFPYTQNYDYVHYFASKSAITEYLQRFLFASLRDYAFIRKDTMLKVSIHIDQLEGVNYLSYINRGKIYYCFITDKEYINDNTTALYLKTDVWTSHFHDIQIQPSYVEREHTIPTDYTLLDEGFELGTEYQVYNRQTVFTKEKVWQVMFKNTSTLQRVKDGKKNSAGQDIEFLSISVAGDCTTAVDDINMPIQFCYATNTELKTIMRLLSSSNAIIDITQVPVMPSVVKDYSKSVEYIDDNLEVKKTVVPFATSVDSYHITKQVSYGVPDHDGLFNYYPYSYSTLTDFTSQILLKHEHMTSGTIKGVISYGTNPSERWYNVGYCGDSNGSLYNITNRSFASLPLADDRGADYILSSRNTLKQAELQRNVSSITSVVTAVAGIAAAPATGGMSTMVGASALGSAVSNIMSAKSELARINDISTQPVGISGNSDGIEQFAFGTNKVEFITYTIDETIKRRILDFWDRYGYKCNKTKIPNMTSRSDHNYVKCSELRCTGEVDTNDMIEFKNIFIRGVTIEHE